jgi:hypothetical protein
MKLLIFLWPIIKNVWIKKLFISCNYYVLYWLKRKYDSFPRQRQRQQQRQRQRCLLLESENSQLVGMPMPEF